VPPTASATECANVSAAPSGSFVRITGVRVALPPSSSLAHDDQLVQPDNLPISHFGIGISDGSGICAVLWLPGVTGYPMPAMGQRVTFSAQVVVASGGNWLGLSGYP
jgi:hypothetical protein